MIYSTITVATIRKSVPTIQWRVQKHAPAAKKMSVAAIGSNCTSDRYCTCNWMEGIP